MTSVSAGHIILTPSQPVGSGRPQREANPGPPHQESSALSTELPPPFPTHTHFCENTVPGQVFVLDFESGMIGHGRSTFSAGFLTVELVTTVSLSAHYTQPCY